MANNSNSRELKLTTSQDFEIRIYIYEGNSFNISKHMDIIRVNRVNRIIETDNTITFYYFNSPVGVFSKGNVICYTAVE